MVVDLVELLWIAALTVVFWRLYGPLAFRGLNPSSIKRILKTNRRTAILERRMTEVERIAEDARSIAETLRGEFHIFLDKNNRQVVTPLRRLEIHFGTLKDEQEES